MCGQEERCMFSKQLKLPDEGNTTKKYMNVEQAPPTAMRAAELNKLKSISSLNESSCPKGDKCSMLSLFTASLCTT